jgi:hypothetical protein
MSRWPIAAATALLALAAARAAAHWPSPESMVAALNAPESRAATGVERAERDAANPRVLIVRVGTRWFGREGADRLVQARCWREDWRRTVPQGVVAVLDARSDAPVVGFGPRGAVFLRTAAGGAR